MTTAAMHIRWWGWALGVGIPALVLVLVSLPPYVDVHWQVMLKQVFAPVCHQIAERSFHVDGVSLAVCHRCYGIFCGLFAGPVLYLFARRWEHRWWRRSHVVMVASIVPMALDWTLDLVNLWQNTPLSRVLTGAVFGLAAGLMVAQALSSRR